MIDVWWHLGLQRWYLTTTQDFLLEFTEDAKKTECASEDTNPAGISQNCWLRDQCSRCNSSQVERRGGSDSVTPAMQLNTRMLFRMEKNKC